MPEATSPLQQPVPIVAIATAPGRGGVGIVRLSGARVPELIPALCARNLVPRHATHTAFVEADGRVIDQGLALYFAAPHSYTGEDVLELQAHGGPVVLQLLLARCLQAGERIGLRLAEPGEFTQRAFLNDKLDLAQAEAVADLIDASTEAAARSASRSLAGEFSQAVSALAAEALGLRALVEATLDFPEEEIEFLRSSDALARLSRLQAQLVQVQARARQGALLREGLQVVLAGQPNVGKSSLLNALAGAELAIVTPVAGTTRDRITQGIQIEGVPVHVVDTAGLRAHEEAADEVERIGIGRSWEALRQADVVLFMHDLTRTEDPVYQAAEAQIAAQLAATVNPRATTLQVYNKCDDVAASPAPHDGLALSARQGTGLQALRQALLAQAGWQGGGEGLFIARERHLQALAQAQHHLQQAQQHGEQGDTALELLAEELRLAHRALSRITGSADVEAVLGEIFSRFCIGK